MAVARKIAYNVAFGSVAKVFSTILALVSIGFITRYLGKEGFGNYATVLAFLSFFASIADLGLYSIVTREISRPKANESKIIGNIFALRVFASILILLISPAIIWFLDYPIEVKRGILIAVASFVFSSSYQVLNGVFQKNLAMDKVATGELIGKAIQVSVIILAIKLQLGFDWIIGALFLNMLANFLIILFWSRKFITFKMEFDFKYWKLFLKESFSVGVGAMIVFVYFKMDTIMLSWMKTSADVGIYNVAYKVLENLTFFPAMIIGLILPIMSNTILHDKFRFKDISDKTFKFFVLVTTPLVIGTLFLAKDIVSLIGGGQFFESAVVLKILVFAIVAIFFGTFFINILIAANLQKKLMPIYGAAAIFNVAANFIFIPKFSYIASANISVITEALVAILAFAVVYKKIKYKPSLDKKYGIIFSGLIMALFLVAFDGFSFFFLLLGSSAIYFYFLWVFDTIKTSEITSLFNKEA
jgi:O-antigen/teichoic acid export membrane protein